MNPNQPSMSEGPRPEAFTAPTPVEAAPAPAGQAELQLPDVMMTQAVEAAAVRNNVPAQTSHREGYWKKPTEEQIANAKQYGFDLTKQDKYFS